MKKSAKSQLWIWYWVDGGYNSTVAASREEALAKAEAMTTNNLLRVDVKSLHVGTREELNRLDRSYASMFN